MLRSTKNVSFSFSICYHILMDCLPLDCNVIIIETLCEIIPTLFFLVDLLVRLDSNMNPIYGFIVLLNLWYYVSLDSKLCNKNTQEENKRKR